MGHAFDWVDAFADRPFGGNGCAVVHDAAGWDAETCMAFTRETGLVECTFLGPSDTADIRVRYFLASREIPFAGHPTVATVVSMVRRGLAPAEGRVTLETLAGLIPVETSTADRTLVTMTQNAPVFGAEVPAARVAEVVGLDAADVLGQPQIVSTGLPFTVTVLKDHAALRRARLDLDALARLRADFPHDDADVMEPFLVTLQGATERGDTFSRLLLAPPQPPEDPFTGSATGAMAAYLWRHGLIETPFLTAEQGHDMGRPGQAKVEVLGPQDSITGVKVAGTGVVVMTGEVEL